MSKTTLPTAVGSTVAAADAGAKAEATSPASGRSLWVWVLAGFLFLGSLWGAMFFFASKANVQSVPLSTQGATKP